MDSFQKSILGVNLANRIQNAVRDLRVEKRATESGYEYLSVELPYERDTIQVLGSKEKPKDRCVSATHSTVNVFKSDCIIPSYTVHYDGLKINELDRHARKIYKTFEKRHTEVQGKIYESVLQRLKQTLGLT